MRHNIKWVKAIALSFLMASFCLASTVSAGIVTFDDGVVGANDFENGVSAFDVPGGVGASATDTDPINSAWSVTITTLDVLAPEYDGSGVLTGNTLSALAGDDVVTNIVSTEQPGINNPSINNTPYEGIGGGGGESSNINTGEAWIFEFNEDVTLDFIDISSTAAGAILDISVNGTLISSFDYTTASEQQTDPLNGLLLLAGDDITFAARGPIEVTDYRVETIRVVKAVPEPGSLAFLGLASLVMMARRRR